MRTQKIVFINTSTKQNETGNEKTKVNCLVLRWELPLTVIRTRNPSNNHKVIWVFFDSFFKLSHSSSKKNTKALCERTRELNRWMKWLFGLCLKLFAQRAKQLNFSSSFPFDTRSNAKVEVNVALSDRNEATTGSQTKRQVQPLIQWSIDFSCDNTPTCTFHSPWLHLSRASSPELIVDARKQLGQLLSFTTSACSGKEYH